MWRLTASVAAAVLVAWSLLVSAQQTPPPEGRGRRDGPPGPGPQSGSRAADPGPVPRTADGHPDLHGVWLGGGPTSDIADGLAEGDAIPYTALGKKTKESRMAKDDPEANCLPAGVPRIAPYPWRILTTPNGSHMYLLFEGNIHSYRQIFMDGRRHPEGDALNPTWYGHSVGRWEGDTLVIDTVGFNDKFWFDRKGTPHSEQLHTIERWTRPNMGTLVDAVTIEDPMYYSKPFTVTFTSRLQGPNDEILENICQENNQYGPAGGHQNPFFGK
jgi:hypothetical protein